MLRAIIAKGSIPDYDLEEMPGDVIRVTPRSLVVEDPGIGSRLALAPETLAAAREIAPGADVYALEAEWRAFAAARPPRDADQAFLGWVKVRTR